VSVLRDAYVRVRPDTDGFDDELKLKLRRADPGGKAGVEIGSRLNAALRKVDVAAINVKADPKLALAAIAATELRLKELGREAATVEVRVRTERALGELARFKKQLGDVGGDAGPGAAASFAAQFSQRLGPLVARMPIGPHLAVALGGAAVVAAPLLGATISAAVIGGAGIGGVIGGLTLVSKDARVQAAGKTLSERLLSGLQRDATPFIKPVLSAISLMGSRFDEVRVNFQNIFRNSARFVVPLTDAATRALQAIVRGVDALSSKAGPVIEVIAQGTVAAGEAIGRLFTTLSQNGPAAAQALKVSFGAVTTTIDALAFSINILSKGFGLIAKLGFMGHDAKMSIIALEMAQKGSAAASKQAGSGMTGFMQSLSGTTTVATVAEHKFVSLAESIKRITNTNLSAAEATLALREATRSAGEAVDKKSRISMAEERALLGMARSANTATEALDEQGRTTKQATAAHEANRRELIAVAIKMGATRSRAIELANQYLAMPKGVTTAISQPGMPQSRKQVKDYHAQLDRLTRQIKTSVTVVGDQAAYNRLQKLLISQDALKKGIPISAAAAAFRKNAFAEGGWTGPGSKYQPAGTVHADEFVINKESRGKIERRNPGLLNEMNATGRIPGYADGGRVLTAPFPVNAAITKIMTLAEALSKVRPAAPSGGATGAWMKQMLERQFRVGMISGPRAGARTLGGGRSYHGWVPYRAVDFPPIKAMAAYMYNNYKGRLKEAITPYQQYNVHNGRSRRWTGAVWNQHNFAGGNAHNHFAMDGVSQVAPGPFLGYNGTGKKETLVNADLLGGGVHFHFHGAVASKRAAKEMVHEAYKELKQERKIP
jgi:hypothetical protein